MADPGEADIASRLLAEMEKTGAVRIEPGYLQPAAILLDLYGEDIRARAYRTDDPVDGEQMLRPDFTVPVVQAHMASGAASARYAYAGPVWRKQEFGTAKAREFWQAGYENFGEIDRANADADLFALIAGLLAETETTPITGDLALVFAAIDALGTTDTRKAALRRHVWRPRRFQRLLDRFAGVAPFDCDTRAPVAAPEQPIGLRSRAEVATRLEALAQEVATPAISTEEVALVTTLLALKGGARACAAGVDAVARSQPGITAVRDALHRRLDALDARGIDTNSLEFEGSFGRASMEYYDGFTFAFRDAGGNDIAQGGRYDALTRRLGGTEIPAVGGVIRPGGLL